MIHIDLEILGVQHVGSIKGGVKVADIGQIIESEARKRGYTVTRNLTGHGIGRSLHEEPHEIANYRDRFNMQRFKKNSVVAIETFISTASTLAKTQADGWTLIGNIGGLLRSTSILYLSHATNP